MSEVLIVCGYMACVPVVNAEHYQMQATVSAYAFRDINDQGSHGRSISDKFWFKDLYVDAFSCILPVLMNP